MPSWPEQIEASWGWGQKKKSGNGPGRSEKKRAEKIEKKQD